MSYPRKRADKAAPLEGDEYDRNLGFATLGALLADTAGYSVDSGADGLWHTGDKITCQKEGFRYEVAASGASDHHLTTAGGVKLKVLPGADGAYNFMAFNPAADGVTDDYAKLILAIEASIIGTGFYRSGPAIFFPDATYFIGSTVELKRTVRLFGNSSGLQFDSRAALVWPQDTAGIVINRYNTNNGTAVTDATAQGQTWPTNGAADASIIEGLRLFGGGGTNREKAGIWLRARAMIRNVYIHGFAGDGMKVVAAVEGEAPGQPEIWGNASNFRVEYCTFLRNGRHGFNVAGADASAGIIMGCDSNYNGRCGFFDNSYLGNTYIQNHASVNGGEAAGPTPGSVPTGSSSLVTFGGNRYYAAFGASEADLVATQPGTNPAIWKFDRAGGVAEGIPTWQSSQTSGTYFWSAPYAGLNDNARSVFIGNYAEGGQPGVVFNGPMVAIGGIYDCGISYGSTLDGTDGGIITAQNFKNSALDTNKIVVGGEGTNEVLTFYSTTETNGWSWKLRFASNDWVLDNAFNPGGGREAFRLTGENTSQQFGTGAAIPYLFTTPVFGLGLSADARRQTNGTAAPTTGAWARGDIVWNRDPTAGGGGSPFAGWICTAAGSPGTWKTFGAISA